MFEVAPEVGERTDSIQMCVIRAIQSRVVVFRVFKEWGTKCKKQVADPIHKACNRFVRPQRMQPLPQTALSKSLTRSWKKVMSE